MSAVVYDEFGRESIKYLPFASTATDASQNDGLLKLNAFQQQEIFYTNHLTGQGGELSNGRNWAYGQTLFEPSPLNRVSESFAPRVNWAGTAGNPAEDN